MCVHLRCLVCLWELPVTVNIRIFTCRFLLHVLTDVNRIYNNGSNFKN